MPITKAEDRDRLTVDQIDAELREIRPPGCPRPWDAMDRIDTDDLLDARLARTKGR